jgi:hypothetical protein
VHIQIRFASRDESEQNGMQGAQRVVHGFEKPPGAIMDSFPIRIIRSPAILRPCFYLGCCRCVFHLVFLRLMTSCNL